MDYLDPEVLQQWASTQPDLDHYTVNEIAKNFLPVFEAELHKAIARIKQQNEELNRG